MLNAICRASIVPMMLFLFLPRAVDAQLAPGVLQSAAQAATITGMVTQSDGAPIAGANVYLNGPSTHLTTISDMHGTFSFTSVPYGTYNIEANAANLGTASRAGIVVKGDITVTVQYLPQSSRGLKEIARVATSSSGAQINVTPANIASIRPSDYAFQGNMSWRELVNQIPGVVAGGGLSGGASTELWSIHNGAIQKIAEDTRVPLRLVNDPIGVVDTLAVAPSGNAVVVAVPVESVPLSWAEYEAPVPYMRIKPQDSATLAPLNSFRPVEYTLVNLTNGKAMPLIDAPNGRAAGSVPSSGAAWSPSGARVLLMNTFLPREGVDAAERIQRLYPCLGAVVDIHSQATNCVAFDSYDYQSEKPGSDYLLGGSFGTSDDEVVLHMFVLPNAYVDRYYYEENESWRLVKSTASGNATASDLAVSVKQDINTPPVLWATDPQNRMGKKLWDPNQQLVRINLGNASVLRWKDASGYEWVAGLVKPPNYIAGKRYPLVIQTHGFEPDEFMSDGEYTTAFAARPLASVGFIVLQMPYNRAHLVSLQEIPDQLRGFESAIALLDAKGLIDPKRVGIIGFSRTCYYVEGALIAKPKLFAAASITDGVDESYLQYLLFGIENTTLEQDAIYGTTPFGGELHTWVKEAPGFNLYRVNTPLLIASIGPASILEEWEIYSSLRMQKRPVDLMYIPGGQHILQKPLDRLASQQSSVDWFRFWLQGYEDPNPSKATQYRHWEALLKLQKANHVNIHV